MTKQVHRAYRIWMKMSFWGRVERSITILGSSAVLLESVFGAGPIATGITAGFSLVGQQLAVWFDDKNGDGVADVFQESIDIEINITNKPEQEG
jgi:proteasome assembly chaperone (PAC2) family protein